MKKALLSIAAMALLSSQGYAQSDTLINTSFTNPVGTTDSFAFIISGYGTAADNDVYQAHTNFLWNLDDNTYSTKRRWIQHIAATGYDYANKFIDTLNHQTFTTAGPQWVFMPELLTDITAGGIIEYGINVPASGYSLSTLMGGTATDSLKIPAQTALYYQTTVSNLTTTRTKVELPLMFTTATWFNSFQDTIHGSLTYAIAGLVDTPFHIKTEVQETKDVIGWGKMRLRKPLYMMPAISDTLNVIQVRCTLQVKDYYYIGTDTASTIMLNAIGVAGQGVTRNYYYDEYYREGFVEPLMTIRMNDATYSLAPNNGSDVHLKGLNPTEVEIITKLSNVEVYPNPVKNGLVNININGTQNTWNYSVININGQSVKAGKLNVSGGKAQIELPANLPAGTYQMLLENGDETIVKSLSIVE